MSLLALSFVIVFALVFARGWVALLLQYFISFMVVWHLTDGNAVMAVFGATAVCAALYCISRWLHNQWLHKRSSPPLLPR